MKERVTKTEADIESLTLNLETHHTENAERIKEVDEAVANELGEKVGEMFPECDVEVHFGGQPIYYYVVSVE